MRVANLVFVSASRNGKVWLNALLDRVIDACNTIMVDAKRIRWPTLRSVALELARLVGDLALLLLQFPRVDAFQLTGAEGRVVFVGRRQGVLELQQLLFSSGEAQQQELGRVALWRLPAQSQQWLSDGAALVICELSRLYPWRLQATFTVTIPTLVRQSLPLPKPIESLVAGSKFERIRWRLNRAQKTGFSYRFGREQADFDHFYHRMYVPYITTRHGRLATVGSYQAQLREFTKGGLVLVTQNEEPIAGMLVTFAQDVCYAIESGILDANPALFRQEVQTVTYWSVMQWAHSQGAAVLDLAGSCAWQSDGVFTYKRRWGAKVTRLYAPVRSNWTFLMHELPPKWRDHVNRLGLITEHQGKFYGAWLQDGSAGLDENMRQVALPESRHDGLSGLAVVSPNRTTFYDASDGLDETAADSP